MIEELTIQGYQQTVRHVIFKCYETLVDKYLDGNLCILFYNKFIITNIKFN